MKTRKEIYGKECAEILRNITLYHNILDCLKPLLPQIERALYLNRRPYGSFKLQETEKALSHKGNYVLVSCCDVSKDLVPYEEYRWFRVPDNFNE